MATLQLQIISGLGTSTKTLTFAGPDAQRIFNGWKAYMAKSTDGFNPNTATQDDFMAFLGNQISAQLIRWVSGNETVVTPPAALPIT